MKDSSKLLSFNINRDLKFKAFRVADFNPDRDLAFDLNRNLSFDSGRDLGFGKRGVIFRGYVCPVCGAPVAKDASKCDECDVQFERTVTRKEKRSQKKSWARGERSKTPPKKSKSRKSKSSAKAPKKVPSKQPASKQRRSTFQCPVCGKLLYVGTSVCPSCDVSFSAGRKVPTKKSPPRQQARAAAPGIVYCQKCNYSIPPTDKFCRRCGSTRPKGSGTTVSWQDFQAKGQNDGLVSWDEYSKRG